MENNKSKVGSSVLVGNCPQHCSVGLPCCVPSCLRHKVDHHRTGGGQDRPLLQTFSPSSILSSCLGHKRDLHRTLPWTGFSSAKPRQMRKVFVESSCQSPPLRHGRGQNLLLSFLSSTLSSCHGHRQDPHRTPPWTEFSSPERHHLTKIHVDAPCWSPPLEHCRTTRQKQGWPEAAGSGWIRTLSSCRAQWHWGWDQAPIYTTFPLVLKQSPFLDGKT